MIADTTVLFRWDDGSFSITGAGYFAFVILALLARWVLDR